MKSLVTKSLVIAAASAALLSASVGMAHAQAPTSSPALPVSGAGDSAPGGLTAHDVVGKRLRDANGNELGQIVGVSKDGASAEVRPAHGATTTVSMAELSLGTGARTVILGGEPAAPPPSRHEQSSTTITSTTSAPTVVVLPPQ